MPAGSVPAAAPYAAGGMGGLFAGSLLSSMAGTVLGSMIAQHFFAHQPDASALFGGAGGHGLQGGFADAGAADTDVARDVNAGLDTFGADPDATPLDDSAAGSDFADFGDDFDGGDTFDV
jgi:hypothetical protein